MFKRSFCELFLMDISEGRNIISRPCITVKYYQRYLSQEQHGKSYDIMIECLSKAYLKNWSSRFFFHYFDSFAGEICRRLNYSNLSIPCKNLLEYRTTHTSFGAYMILLGYLPLFYFPWLYLSVFLSNFLVFGPYVLWNWIFLIYCMVVQWY